MNPQHYAGAPTYGQAPPPYGGYGGFAAPPQGFGHPVGGYYAPPPPLDPAAPSEHLREDAWANAAWPLAIFACFCNCCLGPIPLILAWMASEQRQDDRRQSMRKQSVISSIVVIVLTIIGIIVGIVLGVKAANRAISQAYYEY